MPEPTITSAPYGEADGQRVERFLLTAGDVEAAVLTYGGIIQSLRTPERNGERANVVLGFADFEPYRTANPFFGCITGRYANRIAGGAFVLDGQRYVVARNNGANHLHGGVKGFDKHVWAAETARDEESVSLVLSRTSPDGEEGYPGTLQTRVAYRLTAHNELWIDYRATTDAPTIVNLTNHSYFNLAGEGSGSIDGHQLQLMASRYVPTDAASIPTGEIVPVAGTPFDFTEPRAIGERIRDARAPQIVHGRGYDHTFVFDRPDPGDASLIVGARAVDPTSGRTLTVSTTEPGVQFYTGNYLDGSVVGASKRLYRQGDGFALETQHFPNSPNQPSFPSTVLRPGVTFTSTTVLAFSVT
jgi:aldose 1-epimerase